MSDSTKIEGMAAAIHDEHCAVLKLQGVDKVSWSAAPPQVKERLTAAIDRILDGDVPAADGYDRALPTKDVLDTPLSMFQVRKRAREAGLSYVIPRKDGSTLTWIPSEEGMWRNRSRQKIE